MMTYRGYTGTITAIDEKQGIMHGEVAGIRDVVTFQGTTLAELIQAFHDSVDDYLAFCAERREVPEKPYSGKFLLRLSPSLHQQAALAARKAEESLNTWVARAIQAYLRQLSTGRTRSRTRKGQKVRP
jgi:predicted HicB family RNase H-like nuclease